MGNVKFIAKVLIVKKDYILPYNSEAFALEISSRYVFKLNKPKK